MKRGRKKGGRNPASKKQIWLKLYLDEGSATFMNATEASAKAGFKCRTRYDHTRNGHKMLKAWAPDIERWVDEHGLSDARLKAKLLGLLDAKKTEFYLVRGKVDQGDLPAGCRVYFAGVQEKGAGKSKNTETHTLVAVDVEEPELQRRSLDMAFKAKGLYAPERWELTGKDGGPIETKSEVTTKIKAIRDARKRFDSD